MKKDSQELDEKYLGQRFPGNPRQREFLLKILRKTLDEVEEQKVWEDRERIFEQAESIVGSQR